MVDPVHRYSMESNPAVDRLEQLRAIVTLAEWHLRTSTAGTVQELDAEENLEGAVWDLADSLVRAVLETLGDQAILMPDDARWELVDLAWAVAEPRHLSADAGLPAQERWGPSVIQAATCRVNETTRRQPPRKRDPDERRYRE